MRHLLAAIALFIGPPALAQGAVQIDPGMTRAQVIERLGKPATERSSNGFTYLFFINGCERTCGMNDLVTLRGDSVVDAIFRAPQRSYSGRSTSPEQNRNPRANRGPLTVSPGRPQDSVVLRIVPADAPARPDSARPPVPPGTAAPVYRSDTVMNPRVPVVPPGSQPPVYRSDTVMNPRVPVAAPRTDSVRPAPPAGQPPRTPPPTQPPPAP